MLATPVYEYWQQPPAIMLVHIYDSRPAAAGGPSPGMQQLSLIVVCKVLRLLDQAQGVEAIVARHLALQVGRDAPLGPAGAIPARAPQGPCQCMPHSLHAALTRVCVKDFNLSKLVRGAEGKSPACCACSSAAQPAWRSCR